jgi:transposase
MINTVRDYDKYLEQTIHSFPDCKKLLKFEGVGRINAVNLYIALSEELSQPFKKGKGASACVGLTPIQYSSGMFMAMDTYTIFKKPRHCAVLFLSAHLKRKKNIPR